MTPHPASAVVVGLSISEAPDDELVRLGLSQLHLRHAFIEMVRHILVGGWSVAYGGDLRRAGYTEALFELVRMYEPREQAGPERVTNYLAWPLWVGRSPEDDASLTNVATLVRCPPPPGVAETLPPFQDRTGPELLTGSLALSKMRRRMTSDTTSRVVLGGRVQGQTSLLPGVIEEAIYTIKAKRPLFVAGGFGGSGRVLATALEGGPTPELTIDYQLVQTPRYEPLLAAARARNLAPDFEGTVSLLGTTGMGGLRNGLDETDNRRLARTDDTEELVTLVLRGLNRLYGPSIGETAHVS